MTTQAKAKKILVFRIGHLGDTLIALPAFWQLRNTFPESEITLLSNVDRRNPHYLSAKSILPESGIFDAFLDYPTGVSGIKKALAMIELWINIRREKYDLVVYLMTRNRTREQILRDERFFKTVGIAKLKGFSYLLQNRLDEHPASGAERITSESGFLIQLLSDEGITNENALKSADSTDLLLTNDEKEFGANVVKSVGSATKNDEPKLIAIAPGSKWESKKWETQRFSKVILALRSHFNIWPIIFGGKEDRETGDEILSELSFGSNLAGNLNVRQSAAVLSHCSLYIGNDTGTMHLAASVGVPCVAIFSAIDWVGRWDPIGEHHEVIRKRVDCEGCHSPVCLTDRRCLDQISAEEVAVAAQKILLREYSA